jgi:YVTN family beta-propeller protein
MPAQARDPTAFLVTQPYEGVTAIDLSTNAVTKTPLFGQDIGEFAFSPDGRTAYVAFGGGIKAINAESKQIEGETIGNEGWVKHIVVTPDGAKAFAAEDKSGRIFAVELAGRREDKAIWLDEQDGLEALAITPDGRTVFAMDSKLHAVIPVEVATDTVGSPIVTGTGEETLSGMAMSPDGRTLYVAQRNSDSIAAVDVASRSVRATIRVPEWSIDAIALSPDGSVAYVAGASFQSQEVEAVVPVDLARGTLGAWIPVGKDPNSIAVTPDGRMAYVTNYNSASVTPIDLTTRTAEQDIAVGNYPSAIAIDATLSAPAPGGGPPPAGPSPAKPTARVRPCLVPHLARTALPIIRKRLRRNHCRLGRVRYRHSRHRRGHAISQSARPGRRLPTSTRIGVVLSLGPIR